MADKTDEVRLQAGRAGFHQDVPQGIEHPHDDHQHQQDNRPGKGRQGQNLEAPEAHREAAGLRQVADFQVSQGCWQGLNSMRLIWIIPAGRPQVSTSWMRRQQKRARNMVFILDLLNLGKEML